MIVKVQAISSTPHSKTDLAIYFDNGWSLSSYHEQDCCEHHWLHLSDFSPEDFEGLEFDLSNDNFFKKIEGFGIELVPLNGWPIRIPGYGSNNGYYSSNLSLMICDETSQEVKRYNITKCQSRVRQ